MAPRSPAPEVDAGRLTSGATAWLEMLLGAHGVGLSKPGTELSVDLAGRHKTEVVDMVSGRDRVDAAEPWMWQSAGEHDMAIEPSLPRRHLGERHPHLKRDARLLWKDDGRTASRDRTADGVEEHADSPFLAPKVIGQVVPAAGMRLVAVGEAPLAAGTGPEWRAVPCRVARTGRSLPIHSWTRRL